MRKHFLTALHLHYAKNLRGNLRVIHGTGDNNVRAGPCICRIC